MSCLTEISAAGSGANEVLSNIDEDLLESCSLRLALHPSAAKCLLQWNAGKNTVILQGGMEFSVEIPVLICVSSIRHTK